MRSSFRIEPFAALLAGLIVALPLSAAAAEARTGQIYQQRAADGRIVLTDRPSATAVTERTWQVEREDPSAAAQRASDVRREAEAVSERVQRRIDAQERMAAADQQRALQAQRDVQMGRADEERYAAGYGYGYGYGTTSSNRFWYERKPPFFELGQPQRMPMQHGYSRPGRPSKPGSPGSR